MDMTKMGAFLQALRKEQGLTQEQLGEQIGVTGKTISRWETGTYTPPVDMLLMLSERYDVSMNELVAGERLSPEALPEKAEENLTLLMKENAVFQLHEQKAYWKQKWQHDHRWTITLLVVLMVGLQLVGIALDKDALNLVGIIIALGLVMAVNNARDSYVEHHLYDEKLDR